MRRTVFGFRLSVFGLMLLLIAECCLLSTSPAPAALTTAERNRLGGQFIESFVAFIRNKRMVTALETKAQTTPLTPDETAELNQAKAFIVKDRQTFAAWRTVLTNDGLTLPQIKTFLLNNRAAILDLLKARQQGEIDEIADLRTDEIARPPDPKEERYTELLANWQARVTELEDRITKRETWQTLTQELKDKSNNDFVAEAEM